MIMLAVGAWCSGPGTELHRKNVPGAKPEVLGSQILERSNEQPSDD